MRIGSSELQSSTREGGGGEHADHGMRGNESDEKARDPEGDPGKEKKKGTSQAGITAFH